MISNIERAGESASASPSAPCAWQEIRASLEETRMRLHAEITHYPPPIPACDADFNYLLEERARLCQVLDQMRIAAVAETLGMIDEYVGSSRYIDAPGKQAIKKCLTEMALS